MYNCNTWMIVKEQRKLEAFLIWCYRRMFKISTDMMINEELLKIIYQKGEFNRTVSRK